MTQITVCMGSSCFSRGNSSNAEIVQQFLQKHNIQDKVQVRGCLCEGDCKNGPNIRINGILFSQVAPEGLEDLLKHELGVE